MMVSEMSMIFREVLDKSGKVSIVSVIIDITMRTMIAQAKCRGVVRYPLESCVNTSPVEFLIDVVYPVLSRLAEVRAIINSQIMASLLIRDICNP